jgi:hypothetical protein
MFNVEYIQQCWIKFEPPKHKRALTQCANCQRYCHTKNYCQLKPRCFQCAGDHLTNQYTKKKDLVMSSVPSGVEIFLRITRGVQSTMTYKRKHTHLSGLNNTLLPHK